MTNKFFAFGRGTGGTRTLARLLNINTKVECGHELKTEESPKRMHDRSHLVHFGEISPELVVKEERFNLVRNATKRGKVFGEVNGVFVYYILGFNKIWPDAKFIYTFRNPKKQIISHYNRGGYFLKTGKWVLKPKPEIYYGEKINFTRFDKCAWSWADYNETAIKLLSQIPKENLFIIKFEDFIKGRRVDEMYSFLGLKKPPMSEVKEILSHKIGSTDYKFIAKKRGVPNTYKNWSSLPEDQRVRANKIITQTSKALKEFCHDRY
jgi:hypothetical protein